MLDYFPVGWWHAAETQASKYQQCAFQSYLRSLSRRSERNIRSTLGAPAALRPGSHQAGAWTGVLSFGDCPMRQVPGLWPSGEYESGRVLLTAAQVFGHEFVSATVYLPPKGPTYPRAVDLSEALLTPITEELVLGRSGYRVILGDMNNSAGSLRQMQLWQSRGWVELQDLMLQKHGIPKRATCKNATAPDQIWLSPEVVPLVQNLALWNVFPDHQVLIAGLSLPLARVAELQWRLPGHIPWDKVNQDRWISSPDWGPLFQSNPSHVVRAGLATVPSGETPGSIHSATMDFRRWSASFEQCVSQSISPQVGRNDRSFFGRGSLTKPRPRKLHAPLLKPPRPGELAPASGFLNRSVAAWYKQMRRLQSYCHAINSSRAEDNYLSRAALWRSIWRAPGFCGGFPAWWVSRPYQEQGTPCSLPVLPPDRQVAQLIFDDFAHNYRRYEHWQLQRRRESCRNKMLATTQSLYACTRKPSKAPLDCLVDTHDQAIEVVDTQSNLVRVSQPYPVTSTASWTLQGHPARVHAVEGCYQVDSDLVLASGQSLICHTMITSPEEIHDRLHQLWSPRWNRHAGVPEDAWDQVCNYAVATLPAGRIQLPPITVQDFKRAVHTFKSKAATGPCSWTRADLVHLTDGQIQQLIEGYHLIEAGHAWPRQWSIGLIHCLQKKDSSTTVDGYRPITVTSIFYRLFAGIRAGQILSQLAKVADDLQCGFMQGHQASDVWFFVNVCLELSTHQATPVHGLVADLVKAYNTLPRRPTFKCLEILGVPLWFLQAWQSHLRGFERYFVVNRCVSEPLMSVTGFPEGCPLACAAMTALDFFWHWALRSQVPRVLPVSFVDNLELICDRVSDLVLAAEAQDRFCALLDLEIDHPRLYAWASTYAGRRELRSRGFTISLGDRDLGGQVIYSKQLRNRVLTDRIASVQPYFGKLRAAPLPIAAKMLNIKQVLWPRALHGIEAVALGSSHLTKLRSGAMRALRWDRPGASPLLRLGLLHFELDPFWQQLWRVLKLFKHQCAKNPTLKAWWGIYCDQLTDVDTNGPFGKVQQELNVLGLHIDAEGRLWYSDSAYVDVFLASESLLQRVLLHFFQNHVASQVQRRTGYDDLEGFDLGLTVSQDGRFTTAVIEQLMIVRDGAFFTNSAQCKFDSRKTAMCSWCNVPDTRMHRYTECSRYDHIRAQHSDLFREWDELPTCFKIGGLVPKNPWQILVWEALTALPDETQKYQLMPTGNVWHLFTDGSCDNPTSPEDALASWSVVLADVGPISMGPLRGIQQCIMRGEVTAILSAIAWVVRYEGDLHLWVDNQNAVDHLRELLQGTGDPDKFEHADLWKQVEHLVRHSLATIHIHKVASHVDVQDSLGPLDDFTKTWNDLADFQAKIANICRPRFFNQVWQKYVSFRRVWKRRVALITGFHAQIAAFDCSQTSSEEQEDSREEELSPIQQCIEAVPNLATFHVQLLPLQDCRIWLEDQCDPRFVQVSQLLLSWLIDQDQSASHMRTVSFLEIYVLCREMLGGPVGGSDSFGSYSVSTFAADFRYFKKILMNLLGKASVSGLATSRHLVAAGIFMPQVSIQFGISHELSVKAIELLIKFVGARPITSAQGFSKPYNQ